MAVLQSVSALSKTGVEPAVSNAGVSQAGNNGKGFFDSIFSKAFETAHQPVEAASGEATAGNIGVNKAAGPTAAGTARLCALLRQLVVNPNRGEEENRSVSLVSGKKSPEEGKVDNNAGQKSTTTGDVTEDAGSRIDEMPNDDTARITALIGQILNELKDAAKSDNMNEEDASKRILIEKTIQRIGEKLDMLQTPPFMAVAGGQPVPASVTGESGGIGESSKKVVDPRADFLSSFSGKINLVENDSLLQIIDDLKQIVDVQGEENNSVQVDKRAGHTLAACFAGKDVAGGSELSKGDCSIEIAGGTSTPAAKIYRLFAETVVKAENATGHEVIREGKSFAAASTEMNTTLQWKNVPGTSPSVEIKDVLPKARAMTAESTVKADAPVEHVVGPVVLKNSGAPSPASAGNAVPAKAEAKAAEFSINTYDFLEEKVVSTEAVNDEKAIVKLATARPEAFERGSSPAFGEIAAEKESETHALRKDQSGNSGNSSGTGIDAAARRKPSDGGASGENGSMPGRGEDGTRGSYKFVDVIVGMQSHDVSVPTSAKADAIPDDSAKYISPERILTQVRDKLAETPMKGNSGVISMKLHPEELGELKVNVRLEDQKLKVEVIAENQVVKDVLSQNLGSLRETLSRHNLTMEKFDVFTAGNEGADQQFREGRQSSQNPQVNRYSGYAVTAEEDREVTAKYFDQGENSLVDVRF